MMINIADIGTMGVMSDAAPWDLPINALTDGRNFRVRAGKIIASGGHQMLAPAARGEIGHLTQTTDFENNSTWIACHDQGADAFYNGGFVPILTTDTTVNPHLWTSCQIGQVTFLNHPAINPVYFTDWGTGAEEAKKLPWSFGAGNWEDVPVTARQLHSHQNFLFALSTTEETQEGLQYFEDRVRWSHPCEPNGAPYTWEEPSVDPSSLAGYVTLGRGGGIVGAESLRDSFVIYSREALNVLDYTGDQLIWRRRTLSQNAGLIGRNALVEVGGRHFFISNEDILSFDGNSATSLLHNRLRKRFATTLNEDRRFTGFACHNKVQTEIWFCVAEAGHDEPNMAYVFNYRDGTWALRDLSTTREFCHAIYGQQPTEVSPWEDWAQPWEGERTVWANSNRQAFDGALIGATDNKIANIDTQYPEDFMLQTHVERTHIPVAGHDGVTTISRVYPHVEGNSVYNFSLGSHDHAGAGTRWKIAGQLQNPKNVRKIDCRTTGELHAWKLTCSADSNLELSGLDFEYQPAGGR